MAETVETAIYRLQIEGQDQIDAMKKSIDGLAVSEDKLTASNRVTSEAIEKRIARYDPLLRAQQAYRTELQYIEKVQASGVGTQQQINALFDGAASRYQAQTNALKGLGDAHAGLSGQAQAAMHSVRSFVEMIATGVSPLRAFMLEMGRFSYVGTGEGGFSGAFKQAGTFISGMISPTTAAIAAVAALGAAALYAANQFDKLQVSSQRAISGAGARTGTTTEDINTFVQRSTPSTTTGLSDKEARTLAEGFTQSGEIVISQLHNMSDAVVGFANQTGKSVDDAVKAWVEFGKDPVKAMQTLADTFGPLDQATQDLVRSQVEAGDKTAALQTIVNAYSGALKDATDNMTFMEKAARALITTMGGVPKALQPVGIDTQIANVKKQLDAAIASAPDMIDTSGASKNIEMLTDQLIKLQAQLDKTREKTATAVTNDIADKANAATRALEPEIAQMEALRQKIEQIQAAQAAGLGTPDMANALTAARNQLQALQESMDTAARLNDQIAQLRLNWQGVSGAVALALQTMQNQLPVIQAVTGQQKMAAQAAADYANALLEGKSELEASLLAAAKLEAAQAAATTSVKQQVESLKDSTAMIKAQQNGTEATTAAAIAYKNAIASGADSTAAAALSSATLANYSAKAAGSAAQFAEQMRNASMAAEDAASAAALAAQQAAGNNPFAVTNLSPNGNALQGGTASGSFPIVNGQIDWSGQLTRNMAQYAQQHPGGPGVVDPQTLINMAAQGGNVDAAIAALQGQSGSDYSSAVQQLYGLKISGAADNAGKISATQQEIGYLQGQPASLQNLTQITSLQQSLEQLKTSTDTLNSTNTTTNELLSPYYNQDPRTSHIGFRSQGMAGGGYVDVPGGYSANDNLVANIPVASGERIFVDPMNARRGITANSGNMTINISSPVIVQSGANTDQIGRTLFQSNQALARQLKAATQ